MVAYYQEVRKLENKFDGLEFAHELRGRNEAVDELAKLGSSRSPVPPGVFLQELHDQPSKRKKPRLPHLQSIPRVLIITMTQSQ